MKLVLSICLAASFIALLPGTAGAWYCRNNGYYGGSHWGRSSNLSEARAIAIYWCEKHGGGGCARTLRCVP